VSHLSASLQGLIRFFLQLNTILENSHQGHSYNKSNQNASLNTDICAFSGGQEAFQHRFTDRGERCDRKKRKAKASHSIYNFTAKGRFTLRQHREQPSQHPMIAYLLSTIMTKAVSL